MRMPCLNDTQIQTVADEECGALERAHVAACASCAARVARRRQQIDELKRTAAAPTAMPGVLAERVVAALAAGTPGATRLRPPRGGRPQARRWIYSGLAVAAVTLLAVMFVIPVLRKRDTTVSAAEILARSASQLAAAPASGVEVLVYELTLDGAPREMMPDYAGTNGVYRVRQIIDHAVPGHFLFASYDASGVQLSSVAQDPATRRRVMAMRVDGQPYRFEMTLPAGQPLSLPDIQRLHMQASVALMQASGNQRLQVLDTPDGRAYRIDVPSLSTSTPAAVWDLSEAHLIVDATDFHVVEFAVKGAVLKQPYSVAYKLLTRDVHAAGTVAPDEFEVPVEPGAIVLHGGDGSPLPAADAFIAALRELARTRQAR
jgi:hypothetical protein